MQVSSYQQQALFSLKQAIGVANLRTAMHQDAQSVNSLLRGMEEANAKAMEHSVTPHKGNNIDISL